MTHEEQEIVRKFRDAVDLMLTSASNPGRAAAVLSDNTPGTPYHNMVMAKIEVDALLWKPTNRASEQQEVPPMDSHSVACAKCGKTLTVRWSVGDEVSIFGIICPCGHRTATNQSPVKNTDR